MGILYRYFLQCFLTIKLLISLSSAHKIEYIRAIIATTTPTVIAIKITTQLSSASSSHGHLTRKRGIAHAIESRNWHVSVSYNEPAANYALDHTTPGLMHRAHPTASSFIDAEWNRGCVGKRDAECYGHYVKNSITEVRMVRSI